MNSRIIKNSTIALLFLAMSLSINARELVTIGGGGVAGVYFPTAVAICKLMNRNQSDMRCTPSSTAGSIYNIDQLRVGKFQFAMVQSDWQFLAAEGSEKLKNENPYEALRAVMSLYPEPFSILVKNQSSFESFNDLKGYRVNFGPKGSGQQATSDLLLQVAAWNETDLINVTDLSSEKQPRALCSGQIDAMIYIVGYPSHAVNEAISMCGARLIPVEELTINRLTYQYPFYRKVSIPGEIYKNNDESILTFGVGATLVTDASVNDDIVYHLVDSVFENLKIFKKLHPALKYLLP